MTMGFGNVGTASVQLELDAKKVSAGLKSTRKMLSDFATEASSQFRQVKSEWEGIASAGRRASVVLTGALSAVTYASAAFEKQMASVATMLDDTGMRMMPELSRGVQMMARDFGEGTDTLSRGLYDILSASIPVSQSMQVLEVSAMAAGAGMTTTGVAADAITTLLNSYGMSADWATEVSDKLFATLKRGKTTFDRLAGSIGLVASSAAQSGMSLDEVSAALATATRNGVKTEIAVTGLNAVLMAFLKPTEKASKAAKGLGIELSTNTLKTIGLAGVLQKLKGRRAEEVAGVFENVRALKVIMPLLGDLEGYYHDLDLAINSAGMTAEAYGKATDTLAKKFEKLRQAGIGLLVKLGDMINAFLQSVGIVDRIAQAIGSLADWFDRLSPAVKKAIAALAIGATVLATVTGAVAVLAGAIATIATGPILALVSGILGAGGLTVAMVGLSSAIATASEEAEHYSRRLRDLKQQIADDIDAHNQQAEAIDGLTRKYKQLSAELRADASAERRVAIEQELAKVSAEIAEIVPQAAIAWSDYGKVIDVDITKVQQFADEQRRLFEQTMSLRRAEYELLVAHGKAQEERWRSEKKRAQERFGEIHEEQSSLKYQLEALQSSPQSGEGWANQTIDVWKKRIAGLDEEAKKLSITIAESGKGLADLELNESLIGQIDEMISTLKATPEAVEPILTAPGGAREEPTPLAVYDLEGIEKVKATWDSTYESLRKNSAWTTDMVIEDIDRRMAHMIDAGLDETEEYEALADKMIQEEERKASETEALWGHAVAGMQDSLHSSMASFFQSGDITGMFSSFGQDAAGQFASFFSSTVSSSLGLDSLLASSAGPFIGGALALMEMGAEGVKDLLDGLVGSIRELPDMIGEFVGEIPEIIRAVVDALPDVIDALIDAIPVIIDAVMEALPEIIEAAIEAIPKIVDAVIDAIPKIIDAVVGSIPKIIKGVIEAIPKIIDATIKMLPKIVTALVKLVGKAAVGGFSFDIAKSFFKGFARHGTTGQENYEKRIKDLSKGLVTSAEMVEELRLLLYSDIMETRGGAGGHLYDLRTKSIQEREAWYQEYVEGLGVYTEAQMAEIRNLLQLFDEGADEQIERMKTAFGVAKDEMKHLMYDLAWGNAEIMAQIGGWEEAYDRAWERAEEGGGDFFDFLEEELENAKTMMNELGETPWENINVEAIMDVAKQTAPTIERLGKKFDFDFGVDEVAKEAKEAGRQIKLFGKSIDLTTADLAKSFEKVTEEFDSFKWDDHTEDLHWGDYVGKVDWDRYLSREGGGLGEFEGFARGTNYFPGGIGLVGERGPELVELPRGSRIHPAGSFGGVNIGAIRIFTGDIRTAADEADLERRITGQVTRAIESAVRRL